MKNNSEETETIKGTEEKKDYDDNKNNNTSNILKGIRKDIASMKQKYNTIFIRALEKEKWILNNKKIIEIVKIKLR